MIKFIQQQGKKNLIIFVHGFTGEETTWINENHIAFPEMLLDDKKIQGNFDLAYFSYYSRLFSIGIIKNILAKIPFVPKLLKKKWNIAKKNIAISELSSYMQSIIRFNCDKYENIIIVAHSMGGLVSKAYILEELKKNQVKLFISLSVPHNGSDWATIGKKLFDNQQIVDLAPLGQTLNELNLNWIRQQSIPKTVYFYGQFDNIVPKTSAIAYQVAETDCVACQDDHFTIAKPESNQDLVFIAVKKFLIDFLAKIDGMNENYGSKEGEITETRSNDDKKNELSSRVRPSKEAKEFLTQAKKDFQDFELIATKFKLLPDGDQSYVLDNLIDDFGSGGTVESLKSILSKSELGDKGVRILEKLITNATLSTSMGIKVRILKLASINLFVEVKEGLREAFYSDLISIMLGNQYTEVNEITPAIVNVQETIPESLNERYIKALFDQACSDAWKGAPAAKRALASLPQSLAEVAIRLLSLDMLTSYKAEHLKEFIESSKKYWPDDKRELLTDFLELTKKAFFEKYLHLD